MSYRLDIGDKAFFINRESKSGISQVTIVARHFRTGVFTVTETPELKNPVKFETEEEFLFQSKKEAVEYVKDEISRRKAQLVSDTAYVELLENSLK